MAIGALLAANAAGARRQLDARQLGSQRRDAAGYVVAVFRRQAGVADLGGEAKPAENLHRARRDLVALDVRRLARTPRLDHGHIDTTRSEVDGECQPDRTAADHQDAGFEGSHRLILADCRRARTSRCGRNSTGPLPPVFRYPSLIRYDILLNSKGEHEPMRTAAIAKLLIATFALFDIGKASAAGLSESEVNALHRCLVKSWSLPKNVSASSDIKVVLRVLLKQDGALAAPPRVIALLSSPHSPALAESAKRALLACQPFTMLKPENYESWKDMEIYFNPRYMLARE
jgi:hypothetical protein